MAYVPVLSNVNYEDTRRVSKSPCCKILRYQSVTILQRYEYRTREFRVHVLCCLLCLSCSCSVNASVSAAPSLVCPCSNVKPALRLLALAPTAPTSRLLRGTGTPPEVQKFSISVAQVNTKDRGTAESDKCHSEPRKNPDATSSPGPPCQAAGTLGNCREVHLNPAWCVQRPRTPGPPSA